MCLDKPGRGRGRWRAQYDLYSVRQKNINRLVQPGEIKDPCFWFQPRPGKLGQPDRIDTSLLHEPGIKRPAFSAAMLRVVRSAEKWMSHAIPRCKIVYCPMSARPASIFAGREKRESKE